MEYIAFDGKFQNVAKIRECTIETRRTVCFAVTSCPTAAHGRRQLPNLCFGQVRPAFPQSRIHFVPTCTRPALESSIRNDVLKMKRGSVAKIHLGICRIDLSSKL